MSERLRSAPKPEESSKPGAEHTPVRPPTSKNRPPAKPSDKPQPAFTSKEQAAAVAEALTAQVGMIPKAQRTRLLLALAQEYMGEARNAQLTDEASEAARDIQQAEEADPALMFLNTFYLQQLALARGKRLVDSALVNKSLNEIRAARKKRGFFARAFKPETDTAVIKALEEVQAALSEREAELGKARLELAQAQTKREDLLKQTAAEADQLLANARTQSAEIIAAARKEADEIASTARTEARQSAQSAEEKADQIVDEARKEAKMQKEKVEQLESKISELQALEQRLLKNPDLLAVYEKKQATAEFESEKRLQEQYVEKIFTDLKSTGILSSNALPFNSPQYFSHLWNAREFYSSLFSLVKLLRSASNHLLLSDLRFIAEKDEDDNKFAPPWLSSILESAKSVSDVIASLEKILKLQGASTSE